MNSSCTSTCIDCGGLLTTADNSEFVCNGCTEEEKKWDEGAVDRFKEDVQFMQWLRKFLGSEYCDSYPDGPPTNTDMKEIIEHLVSG